MKYGHLLGYISLGLFALASTSYGMSSEALSKKLSKAVKETDRECFDKLVMEVSLDGVTPLMIAAEKGNVKLCQLILKAGGLLEAVTKQGFSAIFIACNKKHLNVVQLLLSHKASPYMNTPEGNHYSLAQMICKEGIPSTMLNVVLEVYPELAEKKLSGFTPLHLAADKGDLDNCQQLLLSYRVFVDQENGSNGFTALGMATVKGHLEVCKALIKAGADPAKNSFGSFYDNGQNIHPFLEALSRGHFAVCEFLASCDPYLVLMKWAQTNLSFLDIVMKKNLDCRFCDLYNNYTHKAIPESQPALLSLSKSIRYGYVPYLEQYYQSRGDLAVEVLADRTEESSWQMVNRAEEGYLGRISLGNGKGQLQVKAINQKNFRSDNRDILKSLLVASVSGRQKGLCSWLFERGAHKKGNTLNQALLEAAKTDEKGCSDLALCKLCIKYGADVNSFDGELLYISDPDVCAFLIEKGAYVRPEIFDYQIITEHLAESLRTIVLKNQSVDSLNQYYPYTYMAKLRLWSEENEEKPSQVNNKNYKPETNTFLGALISSMFPRNGVKEESCDDDSSAADKSNWKRATNESLFKTIRLFLEAGVDGNLPDRSGITSLMRACEGDCLFLARLLIDHSSPSINAQDKEGMTAVHYALRVDNTECLKLLITKKADLERTDNKGYRPLHQAIYNENAEQVRLLLEAGVDYSSPIFGKKYCTVAELVAGQANKEIDELFIKLKKVPLIHRERSLCLKLAEEDLRSALYLTGQKEHDPNAPIKYSMILMQLSYSAEKAFKAFLINHNASAELLHSHKLDELLTACIALDNRFKVLTDVSMKEYKDLSYYATGKKYQEENPHNKVFPIKRAVTIVQQVLTQCQNIMSSEKLPPESSSSSSEAPSNESIKQNLSIAPENKIQINKVRIFPIAIEPRTGELLVLLGQGQTGFYGDFDKTIKGETVEQAISKILNLQTNFQISADTSTPKRLAFTEDNGESIHFIKVRFVPQEELNQTAVSSFKKGYAWIPASYIMQAEKKLTYLGKYSIFKSTFVLLKKYLQSIKI